MNTPEIICFILRVEKYISRGGSKKSTPLKYIFYISKNTFSDNVVII